MKRSRWLLCCLLVATFPLTTMLAAEGDKPKPAKAKKKPPKKRGGLPGIYAHVPKVCKLTEEQTAKFKEAMAAYLDARNAQRAKQKELRTAQAEAKKNNDKDKLKQIGEEIKKMRTELSALAAKSLDVLTDDQKGLFEGHKLYMQMMGKFKKTGLEEAQAEKIRSLCAAKGGEYLKADAKARRPIRNALAKEIEEKILTDEQRAKLKAPPKKKTPPKKPPKKGEKTE
jgi:hypothetical protein